MDAVVVVGVMMRFAASQSTVTHGAHLRRNSYLVIKVG
jgi:hypothetical protein